MKNQINHSLNRRTRSKIISLSVAFAVVLTLTMTLLQANEAAGINTIINVQDENGMVTPAKVTVFNAAKTANRQRTD